MDCFLIPRFRGGNITAVAVAIGEFAIIFVLPLYLINALDLSTMSAGLVLAAMAIGAFFSGAAARRVAARYGAPGAVVQALSEGLTNAAQWSLVAATAFLALGFVGALRVRRAAGEKGAPQTTSISVPALIASRTDFPPACCFALLPEVTVDTGDIGKLSVGTKLADVPVFIQDYYLISRFDCIQLVGDDDKSRLLP